MIRSLLAAATLQIASSLVGPTALYQALSPLTLSLVSPGGSDTNIYEITPYNEFKAITASGNITYGYFSDYVIFNNRYNYHLYINGTIDTDCLSGRLVDVSILCGQTHMIPAIIESPECEFHTILYSPWACGIDFLVGNENASASATPSATRTPSGTDTGTPSPLGFATVFPSQSQTSTSSPSTTPLFMITAWPTTSPINVSPTSSPLFFLTPYPSYDPNANLTAAVVVAPSVSGTTSTILGAVAVGGVALGAIGFIIKHFKNGGTVGGLFKAALQNKDKIQATLAKVSGANSALNKVLNDPNAKKLMSIAQNPNGAIDGLQIPDFMKQSIKSTLPTSQEELLQLMQNPELLKNKLAQAVPTNVVLPEQLQQLTSSVGLDKNQTIDLQKYARMAFEAKPTDTNPISQPVDLETLKKMATEKTEFAKDIPVSLEAVKAVLTPVLGSAPKEQHQEIQKTEVIAV